MPNEVVRSAADAVLEYLKDDDLKDYDKKKEVDDILGISMSPKEFNELVNLGKKITDYDAQDDDEDMADAGRDEEEIDERQGVASTSKRMMKERASLTRCATNRPRTVTRRAAGARGTKPKPAVLPKTGRREQAGLVDGEAMIIDSAPAADKARQAAQDDGDVPAREIDAYWLQRQIGKLYPDAHIQHDKTHDALRILSGEPDEAGGEQKPLEKSRTTSWSCLTTSTMRLSRSSSRTARRSSGSPKCPGRESDEERGVLEREMVSEGLRWILNELHGKKTGRCKGQSRD